MVVHETPYFNMDGLFIFADSDIDEEELKMLRKKIRKMQRRKLSKKNGQADSSSTSSVSSQNLPLEQSQDADTVETTNSVFRLNDATERRQTKRKRKREHEPVKQKVKKRKLEDVSLEDQNPRETRNTGLTSRSRKCSEESFCSSRVTSEASDCDTTVNPTDKCDVVNCDEDQCEAVNSVIVPNSSSAKKRTNIGNRRSISSDKNCVLLQNSSALSHVNGIAGSSSHTHCKSSSALTNGCVAVAKRTVTCLTRCRSCATYSLPDLTDADHAGMKNYVALDCEFVGIGPKKSSALGRCSIVDHTGAILFDRFVKPAEQVTDYRTPWSGLRPKDIRSGVPFLAAQEQISTILKDKVVVGHAVHNDFKVMGISHPPHLVRDTASCKQLREMADLGHGSCALRKLTQVLLGRTIQTGEHCSVTDARASLDLFRLVRTTWEPLLQAKLDRRQARLRVETGRPPDDPELNSYLEDHYWPPDLFMD